MSELDKYITKDSHELFVEARLKAFFQRVSKRKTKTGCRLWKGALNRSGYGNHLHWINNDKLLAHRLSYLIHYGEFNRSFNVCHKCDNPPCVNPEHLFLGTAKDNYDDMIRKNRGRKFKKK